MEKERLRISKNGIKIYSYKNPALSSFYISLFVRAGSMYECERDSGITHFLEHALIRNVNAVMGGSLYSTLDKQGLEFNASTFSEMVQFYVSGAKEKLSLGADILSRVFLPLKLSKEELSAERARIKAEIREDDPSSLARFTNLEVFEGTSLSRPITGTLGSVSRITLSRLEAYRKSIFNKDNLFVYVTGGVTEEELDALAEMLSSIKLSEGEANPPTAPVPKSFGKRDGRVRIRGGDYTMLRFTFDIDMNAVTVPETDLLYDILMSGYNSRFFIEMSERRGIFYDISGSTERYGNIGTVSFSYELKSDAVSEAVELTLSILSSMKRELLSDDECMKAGYVDNALMLYDDARELNFTFAYDNHVLFGSAKSLEERAALYSRVTPEDIRRCARAIFKKENLTLTLKGNKKRIDSERINAIIAKFD